MSGQWRSSKDEQGGLVADLRDELSAIMAAETGLSSRTLVLADWLLDLSTRPMGRVVVALVALLCAWLLI